MNVFILALVLTLLSIVIIGWIYIYCTLNEVKYRINIQNEDTNIRRIDAEIDEIKSKLNRIRDFISRVSQDNDVISHELDRVKKRGYKNLDLLNEVIDYVYKEDK